MQLSFSSPKQRRPEGSSPLEKHPCLFVVGEYRGEGDTVVQRGDLPGSLGRSICPYRSWGLTGMATFGYLRPSYRGTGRTIGCPLRSSQFGIPLGRLWSGATDASALESTITYRGCPAGRAEGRVGGVIGDP